VSGSNEGPRKSLTYRDAGVDIDAGNRAVELMKEHILSTHRAGVLDAVGGFGGLFRIERESGRGPVLVAGTDGVGTKLKLAFMSGIHDTVGIDCVAMNVNDIITTGAEPLFFLDYLAVGQLEPETVALVVKGIAEGCRQAGCALIGGETAELPGFYAPGEYDLAGFAVGMVEEDDIIDGTGIRPGAALLGLRSVGLHSNGYSLVRKVLFDVAGLTLEQHIHELGCELGEELLRPTAIYARALRAACDETSVLAAAHITGGGLLENVPRVLADGLGVRIDRSAWIPQPIFGLLQRLGKLDERELWRTFNMGIGMVLVVAQEDVDGLKRLLDTLRVESAVIGEVVDHRVGVPRVVLD